MHCLLRSNSLRLVFVGRVDDQVNPQIRIPRTFRRFCGLMVKLLHSLKIRAASVSVHKHERLCDVWFLAFAMLRSSPLSFCQRDASLQRP
jgi:hypothetical protein